MDCRRRHTTLTRLVNLFINSYKPMVKLYKTSRGLMACQPPFPESTSLLILQQYGASHIHTILGTCPHAGIGALYITNKSIVQQVYSETNRQLNNCIIVIRLHVCTLTSAPILSASLVIVHYICLWATYGKYNKTLQYIIPS